MPDRKKILFVADKPGWAYDDAALNWKKQFGQIYDIDIVYLCDFKPQRVSHLQVSLINQLRDLNENPALISQFTAFVSSGFASEISTPVFEHSQYDGILFFYSRALRDTRLLATHIPAHKTAVLINNEKWRNPGEKAFYDLYLRNSCKTILCNNQFIYNAFKPLHPETYRVTQGIDTSVFFPAPPINEAKRTKVKETVVGWSGDYKNPLKNIELVKQACEKAGARLLISKNKSRSELNEWYSKIDMVLCMSDSEGGPLMLLEAGACKVPVITTIVGLAREIIVPGENGVLIENDPDDAAKKIRLLTENVELRHKLAANLYDTIYKNWTYEKLKPQIENALSKLIYSR